MIYLGLISSYYFAYLAVHLDTMLFDSDIEYTVSFPCRNDSGKCYTDNHSIRFVYMFFYISIVFFNLRLEYA